MNTLHVAHTGMHYLSAIVAAALISAAVSLTGLWQGARATRLDRQRQLFADAFRVVMEYREFAYRVRRRTPDADRTQITNALSEVQVQLNLHIATLKIEAPRVAEQYISLVNETRRIIGPRISEAWEQHPPTSDSEMQTDHIDISELDSFDTAYVKACNRHSYRIRRRGRSKRLQNRSQPSEVPIASQGKSKCETSHKVSTDEVSTRRFIMRVHGRTGIVITIIALALGFWLSESHTEILAAILGDLITPAAVLMSSAVAISMWITGSQRLPQHDKGTADLPDIVWVFSCSAVTGIGLAAIYRALPPTAPEGTVQMTGSLSLAMMVSTLVGLIRFLLFVFRSVSFRLPKPDDQYSEETS